MSTARFIDVQVDPSISSDPAIAAKLAEVCPVGIFRAGPGGVEIVTDNLDECVLCKLCLNATPTGTVTVKKLYDGTVLTP